MPSFYQLDFEKPLEQVEALLTQAQRELDQATAEHAPHDPHGTNDAEAVSPVPAEGPVDTDQIEQLTARVEQLRGEHERVLGEIYADLSPWDTVRVARHPRRPQTRDYIEMICRDFAELHGDRRFGDDPAMVTGFARIGSVKCLIVGHQKGRDTQEKLACHFGCAHPEGYRKALAKMKLAEKFGLPIVTLVDTPGAYPGLGAEQRGQAEAIAVNLREMSRLRVPIVSVVIGEGGSGGALGIAVADRVAMLQYAWYSVISPEGCAAILWKQAIDQTNRAAADALKLSASDNLELGIIDAIIPEPLGGAHRNAAAAGRQLERWILTQLDELRDLPAAELIDQRYERFRALGQFDEQPPAHAAHESLPSSTE